MVDVIWREDDGLHWDWMQLYNDYCSLLEKAQTQEELNRIYAALLSILSQAYEISLKSFS